MELYVIVEFCRFGNLQRFLYQHRDSYINQVDEITGKINYNIGADVLNRAYSVTSDWYINLITSTRTAFYFIYFTATRELTPFQPRIIQELPQRLPHN